MKNKSPAHRLIQLRRKTEKIVLPKASWDLSNKENKDILNCYDNNRSKNNSSKKSSIDTKMSFKKTQSMTQSTLKNALKNITKDSCNVRKQKQVSKTKVNYNVKKNENRLNSSEITHQGFTETMKMISKKIEREQESVEIMKQYYKHLFKEFSGTASSKERILMESMEKHLYQWMDRCQKLENGMRVMNQITPKMEENNDFSHEGELSKILLKSDNLQENNFDLKTESKIDNLDSEPSECSYIVDPQEEISMQPLRKDLKEKLQLNFSKIDYVRKMQYHQ